MRVLLIDDDEILLEAMSHRLKMDGHDIVVAEDSLKALNILDNEEIDIIVSDIMMPNMSGLELLNLLKEFYFNKVPVILISALSKPDIKLCGLALGAKEFIVKPIDFAKLSFYVNKYGR